MAVKFLSSDLVVMVIFLFFSLYLIALSIRLLNTSIKRFLSPLIIESFVCWSIVQIVFFFLRSLDADLLNVKLFH